ncbi:MAG: hypothetical protein MJK04_27040, partial [Psychrosphaera sp.]|nr:hypothetical protein [Psychrosphaera sp.]
MQQTLGQLLYVTVDGFGPNVKQAIHPDYVKLVKLLNIGGVVPRFGSKNPAVIAASTEALFRAPKQPLLLGLSKTQLTLNTALGEKSITVGLDNVAGWHKSQPNKAIPKFKACFEQHAFIDAFLFKALGLNQALGPMLDQNPSVEVVSNILNSYDNMGLKTTLKYYPFKPDSMAQLSKVQMLDKLAIFKKLGKRSDFILATNAFNRHIDSKKIATLSREWIGLLKRDLGYKGLIIADSIATLLADDKSLRQLSKGWLSRHPKDDPKAVFIARSILAGHDMVLLQGVARQTIDLYEQLAVMACRDDPDGRLLAARITDSYGRIERFKKRYRGALSYRPKVDKALIADVLAFKDKLNSSSCEAGGNTFEFLQLKPRRWEV